jgi:hypothetical protein
MAGGSKTPQLVPGGKTQPLNPGLISSDRDRIEPGFRESSQRPQTSGTTVSSMAGLGATTPGGRDDSSSRTPSSQFSGSNRSHQQTGGRNTTTPGTDIGAGTNSSGSTPSGNFNSRSVTPGMQSSVTPSGMRGRATTTPQGGSAGWNSPPTPLELRLGTKTADLYCVLLYHLNR